MGAFQNLLNLQSDLESLDMRSVVGRLTVHLASIYSKQKLAEVKAANLACQRLLKHGVRGTNTLEDAAGPLAAAIAAVENYLEDNRWSVTQ